jgi:hypothetical protein
LKVQLSKHRRIWRRDAIVKIAPLRNGEIDDRMFSYFYNEFWKLPRGFLISWLQIHHSHPMTTALPLNPMNHSVRAHKSLR